MMLYTLKLNCFHLRWEPSKFIYCLLLLTLVINQSHSQYPRPTDSQRSAYKDWLVGQIQHSLNSPEILELPVSTSLTSLNLGWTLLDFTIRTDSGAEHCSRSQQYCHSSFFHFFQFCDYPVCSHNMQSEPLLNFKLSTQLTLYRLPQNVSFQSSIDECGLFREGDTIRFSEETTEKCNINFKQPFMTLIVQDGQNFNPDNYTVSFEVDSDISQTDDIFLNVSLSYSLSGEGSSMRLSDAFQFYIGSNGTAINGSGLEVFLNPLIIKPLPTDSSPFNITLEFSPDGMIIFIDGEVTYRYRTNTQRAPRPDEILLGFGSPGYKGSIKNIEVYKTLATTNELYSKHSGLPLAKHAVLPNCSCPRFYTDTFNFVTSGNNDFFLGDDECSSLDTRDISGYRYSYPESDNSKWSIFRQGWVSDLTESAEINIVLHQHILMYSVSGRFLVAPGRSGTLARRPISMQVEVLDSQSNSGGAIVYVSDDCEAEFDLSQSFLPNFEQLIRRELTEEDGGERSEFTTPFDETLLPDSFSRKKRQLSNLPNSRGQDEGDIEPKCFSWSDVMNSNLEDINLENVNGNWHIPILVPNDAGLLLNDEFFGNRIKITLNGHHDIAKDANENWYYIGGLRVNTRPHCGGKNYNVTQTNPTDISTYYELRGPDARIYECECEGISGDQCEECVTNKEGSFRYMKSPGVCADCGCSDLSKNPQCNRQTGQCPCRDVENVELAGKQCHWFIEEIGPLYGPVAGGTKVTLTGGYFDQGTLRVQVDATERPVKFSEDGERTFTTKLFQPHFENSTLSVTVGLQSQSAIGPPARFYGFEVRPNPILEDIEPRTSILSGGQILTVTGRFMDSVAEPEIIIYIRQRGLIIKRYSTTCTVVDEFEMRCPTANVAVEAVDLLGGRMGVPEPTTTGLPLESITPSNSSAPPANTPRIPNQPAKRRKRRDAATWLIREERAVVDNPPDDLNDRYLNGRNDVQFTLGFTFDGYNSYKDLTRHNDTEIQELSTLYVFQDPVITTFKEDFGSEVLMYKLEDQIIRMKGDRLDFALREDDYRVEIGDGGECVITQITTNQLNCAPPKSRPEVHGSDFIVHNGQPTPHIQVFAGKNLKLSIGYVYYERNIWLDNAAFRISMIVLIVVVCCVIIGVAVYCLAKRYCMRSSLKKSSSAPKDESYARYTGSKDEVVMPFLGRKLDPDLQAKLDRCRIPTNRLKLANQLGKGNFGLVYKGQLTTPTGNLKTVAVKTLKEDQEMSFDDLENFLTEGTLMIDFKHENVLSLVGVVFEEGNRPMVVLPIMENGDLCTFIKKDDLELVLADLLHFGYQMANGMAYLAKHRFVHRDLAARNCMVDGGYIVKIADFGMSRDVYERDYYRMDSMNKPLPLKWMSIESLKEGKYSSKSDVWAYGITMWELLTRGGTPYPSVSNYHIKEFVVTGQRLEKPTICPPIIYEMMTKCWEEDPDNRPTFSEIAEFIKGLLNGETKPMAGSGEEAGYDYSRNATKNIPEDYLDILSNDHEDYLTFLSDDIPKEDAPTPKITPTPAKRITVPKNTSGNVYVNSSDINVHVQDEISAV